MIATKRGQERKSVFVIDFLGNLFTMQPKIIPIHQMKFKKKHREKNSQSNQIKLTDTKNAKHTTVQTIPRISHCIHKWLYTNIKQMGLNYIIIFQLKIDIHDGHGGFVPPQTIQTFSLIFHNYGYSSIIFDG